MTTHPIDPQHIARDIARKVVVKTALLAGIGIAGAAAFSAAGILSGPWWLSPLSVLAGGVLGLLNFYWLATTVARYYVRQGATKAGATVAGAIITLIKLSAIFVVLFIVIKWELLHVLSLVAGLSLCFIAIIWHGAGLMGQLPGERDRNA